MKHNPADSPPPNIPNPPDELANAPQAGNDILATSPTRAFVASLFASIPAIRIVGPWTHRASIGVDSRRELVAFAHYAASRGWPVFPLVPAKFNGEGGKNPRITNWQQLATTDHAQIDGWWAAMPTSNVGIVCGRRSGLLVVDIDVKPERGINGHESLAVLEAVHGPMPLGPRVRRGVASTHVYLAYDPRLANSVGNLPGVDVRAEGGLVVGAGSFHAASGDRYEWIDGTAELPLPVVPDWLIAPLSKPQEMKKSRAKKAAVTSRPNPSRAEVPKSVNAYVAAALRAEVAAVTQAEEGTRNHTLNTAAFSLGTLVGAGAVDRDVVEAALADAAVECGLDDDEAQRTIASGLAAGELKPRDLSELEYDKQIKRLRSTGIENMSSDVEENLP